MAFSFFASSYSIVTLHPAISVHTPVLLFQYCSPFGPFIDFIAQCSSSLQLITSFSYSFVSSPARSFTFFYLGYLISSLFFTQSFLTPFHNTILPSLLRASSPPCHLLLPPVALCTQLSAAFHLSVSTAPCTPPCYLFSVFLLPVLRPLLRSL